MSGIFFSPPGETRKNGAVRIPKEAAKRFVRALSRVSDITSASLPEKGMPRRERRAGTWASRSRPPRPSAMLNTNPIFSSFSFSGRSGPASSMMTSSPAFRRAEAIPSTVSGLSNSASSSAAPPERPCAIFATRAALPMLDPGICESLPCTLKNHDKYTAKSGPMSRFSMETLKYFRFFISDLNKSFFSGFPSFFLIFV